jgi:acyl-CoA synthetase (AMP-forming)/AMP-acid ligase II
MTLLDIARAHAAANPNAPFVTHIRLESTLTFGKLCDLSEKMISVLRDRNIAPGDRVALVLTNHPILHPLLLACAEAGVILVPVDAKLHPDERAFILENATPRLIVTEGEIDLGKRFAAVTRLTVDALLAEAAATAPALAAPPPRTDATTLFVYTSGTTGSGKAVMLTSNNLVSMATLLRDFYAVNARDRLLCVLPTHHMNGIMITGILPLVSGAQTFLADIFAFTNAKFYWDTVAKYGITIPSLTPSIMAMLSRLFPHGSRPAPVRLGFCGTAPLPADIWQTFEARFGFPVYQGYGLTETTTWATCTPCDPAHRHDSVGRPLGCEIRIDATVANANDRPEGEVLVKGPMVMAGYYKKTQLTRETFQGDFLKTGDIGYFDEKGELHISGRKKEIIIRSGVNVNPNEIDAVIRSHEAVMECKTIGIENNLTGESITTVFVPANLSAPPDPSILKQWVADHMSAFYVPDRITRMNHLPKGPTGKVQLKTLRKILTGELAEEGLKKLTAWKYLRSQPSDPDAVRATLSAAYLQGEPVRFLSYWGCGKRDAIADVDKAALDRLAEYLQSANFVEQAHCKLLIMLNDIHSTVNEIPRDRFESYYDQIEVYARSSGATTIRQSDAWRDAGLNLDQIIDEASDARFDETWNRFPLREQLLSQAEKHFNGGHAERGARRYVLACLTEAPAFAAQFSSHIFITYNGPEMDACLPGLPKLYIYSWKKGKTEKPWFVDESVSE